MCVFNADSIVQQVMEFREFMKEQHIDICMVSETMLKPGVKATVPNYKCYRKDRPTAGGGVAIYIKRGIPHHQVYPPVTRELETVAVEVATATGPLTIVAVYRQPSYQLDEADIPALAQIRGKLIIGGDLNAKHADWNARQTTRAGIQLQRLARDHQFNVWGPEEPTHFPKNGDRPDVLDIALTKRITGFVTTTSINRMSSDHNPVIVEVDVGEWTAIPHHQQSYKRTNWEQFQENVATEIARAPPPNADTAEQALEDLTKAILQAAEEATPPRRDGPPPQITLPEHLLAQIKHKNRVAKEWKLTRNPATRRLLNRLQRELKVALNEHRNQRWSERLSALKVDDNSLWQATQQFTQRRARMPPLHGERGGLVFSAEDKANALADAFELQFQPAEAQDLDHENIVRQQLAVFLAAEDDDTEEPPLFAPEDVAKVIKSLPNKKAPGHDRLTNQLVKKLPPMAITHIADVFNEITRSRVFPTCWKHAEVAAIAKPGKDPLFPQHYRPISLLPTLSKIYERLLLVPIEQHIAREQILPDFQFGFRQKHSAPQQIMRVVEAATEAFNRRSYCGLVLLDVAKAFDSVWHNGLLYKLYTQGFPGTIVKLLRSYLSNRTFSVKVDNALSTRRRIYAGVPQGSVLGPVLYSLYTADTPTAPFVHTAQYADDTAFFTRNPKRDLVTRRLQTVLDATDDWAKKWRITINGNKTQAMMITRKLGPRGPRRRPPLHLQLNGQELPWRNTAKYLGVTLDKKLTWKAHIEDLRNRACARMTKLYPILNADSSLDAATGIRTYCSLVRPIMEYASPIWAYAANIHLKKLQVVQNRALRRALHVPSQFPADDLHAAADVKTLKDRFQDLARAFYETANRSRNPLINSLGQYDPRHCVHKRPLAILLE